MFVAHLRGWRWWMTGSAARPSAAGRGAGDGRHWPGAQRGRDRPAWQGPGDEPDLQALDPRPRDPGAALAQPAVLAGRPAHARRDRAALRPGPPAARDRPVLAPDHDEPRHLPRAARPGGARARAARRDHALPRRRLRAGQASTHARWRASGWPPIGAVDSVCSRLFNLSNT
ncbi:MAG: hypothetical protein MZW92_17285 [Comamonadaceae bacterium]|nr:hypothetical protein [Comamonadaceae bacterium]